MYLCLDCDNVFDEDEVVVKENRIDGYFDFCWEECPNCEGGNFVEAVQCDYCGEWFPKDDAENMGMEETDLMCKKCFVAEFGEDEWYN